MPTQPPPRHDALITTPHAHNILLRSTGLTISRTTWLRWLLSGKVPAQRVGHTWRVRHSTVQDLADRFKAGEDIP